MGEFSLGIVTLGLGSVFRSSLDNLAHSGKTVRCLQSTWPLRGSLGVSQVLLPEKYRVTI